MDILYTVKKVVGFVISPLPLSISVLIVASLLVCLKPMVSRAAKHVLLCGVVALLLFSSPIVANYWLNIFESQVSPYEDQLTEVDNIIVLGCYNTEDSSRPLISNIHECSLYRLTEAVRLAKIYPQAKLVLTGMDATHGRLYSHPKYSSIFLVGQGIEEKRIHLLEGALDTEQESVLLKPLMRSKSNLLISSASHFKRIKKIFNQQKLDFVAVPTEYLSRSSIEFNWVLLIPDYSALKASKRAMYEMLGNMWIDLKEYFATNGKDN